MSKPWIGPLYHSTRLLLLGESAYSWEEEGVLRHPSEDHAEDLVTWTKADFANSGPFMKCLSRGLSGTSTPSGRELEHVWDRVAFCNYVPGSVGVGARTRPTNSMWQHAQRHFLDVTLPRLQPKRIIVLGKTMWSWMPDTSLYVSDDVQGYTNLDGSIALCWAVNHPSRGLGWSKLAELTHFSAIEALRTTVVQAE